MMPGDKIQVFGLFDSIDEHFRFIKSNPKDQRGKDSISWIAPYMDTLYEYSIGCKHITEIGVNQVNSTWAFLKARPKTFVAVDIDFNAKPTQHVPQFNGYNLWLMKAIELSTLAGIDFKCIEGDSSVVEIEHTDLLFIDSLHTAEHLGKELALHSSKVRKYIIIHDTTLFAHELWGVIQQFLKTEPFALNEKITTGCGLTILKRKQF